MSRLEAPDVNPQPYPGHLSILLIDILRCSGRFAVSILERSASTTIAIVLGVRSLTPLRYNDLINNDLFTDGYTVNNI